MPRPLTSPLHIARHWLMRDRAWLLFVEIPASNGGFFRLVRNGVTVNGDEKVWQPASIEIELPGEEAEGALGQLKLSIPNVSRLPVAYLELGEGELIGFTATCWLQHEENLDVFDPALSWEQLILAAEGDEGRLTVECGHPASVEQGPGHVFTRREFPQLQAQGL